MKNEQTEYLRPNTPCGMRRKTVRLAWCITRLCCGMTATGAEVALQWNAPSENIDGSSLSDLAGYRVYSGSESGSYTTVQDVGLVTAVTLSDIPAGVTTHFAVSAYNADLTESSLTSDLVVSTEPEDPSRWHSADYAAPFGVIDGAELARVLSYWRTGGYTTDAATADGYTPSASADLGDSEGERHSSDFIAPYGRIDGTEMARVLAYWRAGGYTQDPAGPDGYAPMAATPAPLSLASEATAEVAATQLAPSEYDPGDTMVVSNGLAFNDALLSLCWRPQLPQGWQLLSATGDGAPEAIRGEIVWTGVLPPSPIEITYTIGIPAWAYRESPISSEVDAFFLSAVNPTTSLPVPQISLSTPEDLDGDGLADAWERVHLGDATDGQAADDGDHDGMSNRAEYLAGTAPDDKRSALSMLGVAPAVGAGRVIRWQSAPGRSYDVLRRTSSERHFVAIAQAVAATTPENRFVDTSLQGPDAGCFYRVQLAQ